jgi:phospholipid/cholesterol/gamma-HCH transport system ATP-binding protein
VVIVTHELDSIRAICDKLIFLSAGNAIFDGTLKEALESGPEEVKNFFARVHKDNKSQGLAVSFNLEN